MAQIIDERQSKYDLLRDEILDKGYDALAFQIFCEHIKKDGGDDVDSWTFEDLQQTVENFKKKEDMVQTQRKSMSQSAMNRSQLQQRQSLVEEETKNLEQQQEVITKTVETGKPKEFQMTKQIDEVNFKLEVECRKPERTKLTDFILENPHKRVEVVMNEYVTKSEGLFSSGYGAFKVQTQPLGWLVWRRFSDFHWLRQVLQKAYPCQLIPPIPHKKMKVNATKSTHLEKRMKVMELFLQNCLHHPLIRSHPALSDFLSVDNEASFKERLVQYDRAATPQRPSEFVTPTGKCTLEITPELKSYSSTLHDYLKNSGEMYTKLQESFKKFFCDLDQLSGTLAKIGEQFTSLSRISDTFCQSYNYQFVVQIEKAQRVYNELSKFMDGWYQNITFQMKNVKVFPFFMKKENFYEFFSYHGQMQEQALEFVDQRNSLQQRYQDMKTKLNDKKEKLFVQGDTNKWDLPADIPKTVKELQFNKQEAFKYMFLGETKQLNDLKENFAFINRQLVEEMNQIMEFRVESYADKFIRVAQMRGLDIAKLHHVLADFLTNMFELQGESTGSMQQRSSIYADPKYDKFFGIKNSQDA